MVFLLYFIWLTHIHYDIYFRRYPMVPLVSRFLLSFFSCSPTTLFTVSFTVKRTPRTKINYVETFLAIITYYLITPFSPPTERLNKKGVTLLTSLLRLSLPSHFEWPSPLLPTADRSWCTAYSHGVRKPLVSLSTEVVGTSFVPIFYVVSGVSFRQYIVVFMVTEFFRIM